MADSNDWGKEAENIAADYLVANGYPLRERNWSPRGGHVETDIITCGVRYLKYSVASYFLLGLSLTSTIILRNVGQVKLPLYTSIITFFINVGANNKCMIAFCESGS